MHQSNRLLKGFLNLSLDAFKVKIPITQVDVPFDYFIRKIDHVGFLDIELVKLQLT